jgi:uncharacterized sulfatase
VSRAASRRTFLRATLASVATSPVLTRAAHAAKPATRPNILFIQTDDQGPWALGVAGNPDAHTPNLDRLCREGAYLRNSFVATPVCSPSRAQTLTSRYGVELGITDWIHVGSNRYPDESHIGLDPGLPVWPRVLQEAGYDTALVGKWHLGVLDRFHPTRFGFSQFLGFRSGGQKPLNPELEIQGNTTVREGFCDDLLTDYALDLIDGSTPERPFLLSVHYRFPHAPWMPMSDPDWALYKDRAVRVPNPDFPDLDIDRVESIMREYLAAVANIDRNVGRFLDALDRHGLERNTIVIFTSDNGYNVGHHGLLHKGNAHRITRAARDFPADDERLVRPNMFDTSLRVPTIVRWPGRLTPGSQIHETFSNLDWFRTILAMAGIRPQKDAVLRGRNALPLLEGRARNWDNDLYGEYSQHHYAKTHLRMYRTPEWKLVRDFLREGHDELYNLAEDPGESRNRIDDPAVRRIRERLEKKLLARMRALHDPVL